MADGSVQFLLESLKQVFLYYGNLIANADTQIELLENDLHMLIAFLRESDKQKQKSGDQKDTVKELVREIRNIVFEIEDVIEIFVIEAKGKKKWQCLGNLFSDHVKLISVAEKVQTLSKKLNHILGADRSRLITGELFDPTYQIEHTKEKRIWKVREDKIVGFEEETKTIISYLMEVTEELDVISIIGLPGLGKTTLAHKIFHHPKVQSHFPIRIWVNVSNEFTKKSVYLSILSEYKKISTNNDNFKNLKEIPDDISHKSEKEIAELLVEYLKQSRFLLVMDDIWTAQAWIDLQEVFLLPAHSSSKILVTSRNEEVSRQANRNRDAFRPPLLTFEESWLLLQLEVFGKSMCPQDLEEFGKVIVHQCRGLPLAVVVIGGILIKKTRYGDKLSKRNLWRKVSHSVATYLNDDPENRMQDIISLSYVELPYYLRPCFLYLGIFPEDYAIPVKKLIRMWIAEGFIPQKKDITLEEIAQDYLEELISKNLAMVDKIGFHGNVKICRLHDTIRQFCKTEASFERENFFQEMKLEGDRSDLEHCRRLCLLNTTTSSMPQFTGGSVRSILIFHEVNSFYTFKISKAFKLLRILDTEPIFYDSFPKDYTKLLHLRFLVLKCYECRVIPKAISKLWNLQTLVVYSPVWSRFKIKANIWKMVHLRHVKFEDTAIFPKIKSGKIGQELQSMGIIDAKCCTEEFFDRLPASLKKLSVEGHPVALCKINAFSKLEKLEKLKIYNWELGKSLPRLPEPLPPKLRSLTLVGTKLEWGYMSTLGMLHSLEVLKLKDHAFEGDRWVATAGGFSRLEVLYIYYTNLAVWEAEADHFPKLNVLVLSKCYALQEIPEGLVENLDKLELRGYYTESMLASVRRIETTKKQQEEKELASSNRTKFRLFIEHDFY